MPTPVVIFDLDGTVLDTLSDLHTSINHALSLCGYPERSRSEVRAFVGDGVRRLVERSMPEGCEPSAVDRVYAAFTAYYRDHCHDATAPYPGILELLSRLREGGVRLAVVSNKDDYAVRLLCERYFSGVFDFVLGGMPERPKKPAPDMLLHAMERLSADRAHAVYVGDSEVDVKTAQNAGLPCISVLWGFRDQAALKAAGATLLSATPEALREHIQAQFAAYKRPAGTKEL